MSGLAVARAEIGAALNSVDGVQYHATPPSPAREGDAWLRWRAERAETAGGFDVTWWAAIVVPVDEAAADAWIDGHIDALLTALRRVAYVTGYGPANLGPENSPVKGLLITMERE